MSANAIPLDSLMAEAARQGRREAEQFRDYLKKLSEKNWLNQSFCTDWTIKDTVLHLVRQGLAMRDVAHASLKGKPDLVYSPQLTHSYQPQLDELNRLELADRLAEATFDLYEVLERATPEQLQNSVEFAFGRLRAADLGSVRLTELSLHSWDVRVVNDLTAKVSRESLPLLLPSLVKMLPALVNPTEAGQIQNFNYQFEVTGAIKSPVALRIEHGQSKARQEYLDQPDVTVKLDSEAFLRLSWGRLRNLDWMIRDGWIKVEGDTEAAQRLNLLFQGM